MDEQLYLFTDEPITVSEIFEAYYDCRKHKRTSESSLSFEVDLERNLMKLLEEINTWKYSPGPYNSFIIEKPAVREVFAASFRDRVVHHLVVNAKIRFSRRGSYTTAMPAEWGRVRTSLSRGSGTS